MVNIQISYDINQMTELDIWDDNFHSVSLYGLMEHLALDASNIRESLYYMIKYILNKKVERDKANNVNNFRGIGKAA